MIGIEGKLDEIIVKLTRIAEGIHDLYYLNNEIYLRNANKNNRDLDAKIEIIRNDLEILLKHKKEFEENKLS